MSPAPFDTLILGQGLAGSALAWHLIEAGERVCVIDDGHCRSSTRVAAGLINPSYRRLVNALNGRDRTAGVIICLALLVVLA